MQEFVKRNSLFLSCALLVFLSLGLMSASVHNRQLASTGAGVVSWILSPVDSFYKGILSSVRGSWERYIYLVGVEDERDQLANRLKALESQNSQLIELSNENQRLRLLLNYREELKSDGILARVVSRDPSNWAESVTVDRGTNDGVKEGQAVVDGNALVGQVIAVSTSSAKVLLITDNVSSVDVIVQSSRAQGIIEGNLTENLRLKYLLREQSVKMGDRIIASGLDGIFPKGALVGIVSKVKDDPNGMFQNLEVEPSTDMSRLENVLIITKGLAN
jgi:rod shape-determining protein MreC